MRRFLISSIGLFFWALSLGAGLWLPSAVGQGARDVDLYLEDPAQEERARQISDQLRCVVCQSQSINGSNAFLARDMRNLVRERVAAGDSDEEIFAFFVDRYGEGVLMKPNAKGINKLLWSAPLILLLLGGGLAIMFVRQQATQPITPPAPLDDEEQDLLRAALEEEKGVEKTTITRSEPEPSKRVAKEQTGTHKAEKNSNTP